LYRRNRAALICHKENKKNEAQIVSERISESMLHNDKRNFSSEIKRIRSHSVDGISGSSSISKLFADKYRELYTSTKIICSRLKVTLIIWLLRRIVLVAVISMFVM